MQNLLNQHYDFIIYFWQRSLSEENKRYGQTTYLPSQKEDEEYVKNEIIHQKFKSQSWFFWLPLFILKISLGYFVMFMSWYIVFLATSLLPDLALLKILFLCPVYFFTFPTIMRLIILPLDKFLDGLGFIPVSPYGVFE